VPRLPVAVLLRFTFTESLEPAVSRRPKVNVPPNVAAVE
jgi:hypothetical protein